jgi:hypothetical protein
VREHVVLFLHFICFMIQRMASFDILQQNDQRSCLKAEVAVTKIAEGFLCCSYHAFSYFQYIHQQNAFSVPSSGSSVTTKDHTRGQLAPMYVLNL